MKKTLLFLTALCLLLPQPVLAAEDMVRTGDITIAAGERVLGDVVALQGDIDIYGEVYGDVVALLGKITLHPGSNVHGDVICLTGAVDLRPGATISGDQVSLGGIGKAVSLPRVPDIRAFNFGRTAFNIVARVLLAVLIGLLFPMALTRIADQTQSHLGSTLGVGALTWLAALPLAAIMALTIIGIPLSLLVLLALWAASYFGFAAISRLAGSRILIGSADSLGALTLGALLLSILLAFPLLGLAIRIALALAGAGAAILTRFGMREGA